MAFNQIDKPQSGETVVLMHTNKGDIKIRMFKEFASKTVENFITHANNGYYNGITFHRVIKDFMIQGGDPTATGCGGESIWGRNFPDEFTPELHNIRGALSMANAGPNTNGSQFFIVQANSVHPQFIPQMEQLIGRGFTEEAVENYKSLGGTPHLDFRHTVFGQVFEGMEVVDKIADEKTDSNDKPLEDVVINSIEVSEVE